jgi:hypothetical protein
MEGSKVGSAQPVSLPAIIPPSVTLSQLFDNKGKLEVFVDNKF